MPGANPRVKEAAAKAACNHEEIISAVHRFEGGPGVSGSGPGTAWKHRAGASLVGVLDSPNVRRESAEAEGA